MSNMSPMKKSVSICDMEVWNDSCSIEELEYAIGHGASGATTNPVIVLNVLKKEMHLWQGRIKELIKEMPTASEVDISWKLIEEMAVKGADVLKPVFDETKGKKGRISIQTNAQLYRDAEAMTAQAVQFNKLASNMMVKMPATAAGIKAFEEATYQGVNINATVSFTVPQAVAVGEAVERGLKRREAEGKDVSNMTPVCTIMVGRLDDWLKIVAAKEGIITNPGTLDWAGVAAFKEAYKIYKEKGFRTRLLSAAYRNHLHWSQLIGDDIVQTIPGGWQKKFNNCDVPVEVTIDKPVDPAILEELHKKFPDFTKAYEAYGLKHEEFVTYGATSRTLRGFLAGYTELLSVVRDFMVPNPDA
ncbi:MULTISPECIES: transaldolase family protein [unclassified Oceanispirochaeta]|uniref:transaldolase family protein n=1 Tax=unclassified Oceanispirochaeta TaxID=2635722 RepID=UPI000E08EBBD|nr:MULTISPECIES: transaldolase family protein [unclassified Oceanispirochaeta]MBF9016720.1 transaldolase family protein [Oceanispirochaeta sp. M2]NPD73075.1 transaldolase [Oceanispirochaeta sp. M1]RDG31178.1 transaldolase [Oceanispirochaeta sp. M1]